MGHIITPEGIKPDSEKVEAINKLEMPKDVKSLQRLLGMVNYVAKFIPKHSELTEPLRILLQKNVAWHWNKEQEEALINIRNKLKNPPILTFYDVNAPVTLS